MAEASQLVPYLQVCQYSRSILFLLFLLYSNRYELPVEDPEYESQRKERMVARGFQEEEHSHTHDHEGDVDMSTSESDNNVGWLFGDDEPHSV